jgi:hypothetical protein
LPPLGNTGGATFTGQPPTPVLAGIDSLYLGFYGQLRLEIVGVADTGGGVMVGEYEFTVDSRGRGAYGVVLDNPWMNISVGNRFQSSLSPPVYVQVKSDFIHFTGLTTAYRTVVSVVNCLFLAGVEREQVSRADIFVDIPWQQGFQPQDINQFVTRARKSKTEYENNRVSSITVGRGDVKARIYNKSLELGASGKDWLYQIWGVDERLPVWRTEIEFRRGFLNDYGIDTFEDLLESRQSLWNYATTDWLSMRIVGNPNPTRRPVTAFWQGVQNATFTDGQEATGRPLTKRVKTGMDEAQAIPQIIGIARSVARNQHAATLATFDSLMAKARQRLVAECRQVFAKSAAS